MLLDFSLERTEKYWVRLLVSLPQVGRSTGELIGYYRRWVYITPGRARELKMEFPWWDRGATRPSDIQGMRPDDETEKRDEQGGAGGAVEGGG